MIPINVSQQMKEPVGSIRNYIIDEVVDTDNNVDRIHGQITLTRTNRSILVKGRLKSGIKISCSRCLNMFQYPFELNIEEEYFPITDLTSLPARDKSVYCTINEHHLLDLTETVQQYTLLAIPIKPLCHQDCAGLCLHCGCDLNRGHCYCTSQQPEKSSIDTN